MTALRLVAQDTSLDSAGRARKRDSVLRLYRVTPTVLESAASRLATRPEHALELLRAIDVGVAKATIKAVTPSAPAAPSVAPPAPSVRPQAAPPPVTSTTKRPSI